MLPTDNLQPKLVQLSDLTDPNLTNPVPKPTNISHTPSEYQQSQESLESMLIRPDFYITTYIPGFGNLRINSSALARASIRAKIDEYARNNNLSAEQRRNVDWETYRSIVRRKY